MERRGLFLLTTRSLLRVQGGCWRPSRLLHRGIVWIPRPQQARRAPALPLDKVGPHCRADDLGAASRTPSKHWQAQFGGQPETSVVEFR